MTNNEPPPTETHFPLSLSPPPLLLLCLHLLYKMKNGLQVVNGALDMIQPHDQQCDYAISCSKPTIEARPAYSDRNELSEWVEQVTKQLLAEDIPESSRTTTSYENDIIVVPETLSELRPRKIARKNCTEEEREDDRGLTLITLLLECAVAISVDNLGEAHRMLLELTQSASPFAPSCAERVVTYFAKAMGSRVINSWLGFCSPLTPTHKLFHGAFQLFNNVSPFIKFAHFTSNQAILEAFQGRDRVHIIDLDIMQGLQWPALFHILATRIEGPPHVRMTGMGSSMEVLIETGRQLSSFAKRLGMSFEFRPVAEKFGSMLHGISTLQVRRGETLAVHWLQHSLYDATGPDWKTMRLLHELSPRVITLVEQEIAHGGGSFLDRFVGSLHYYSTAFDSLGASLPPDDPGRHEIERSLMYREINNVLAIGGPARSGEEKFRRWRSELRKNGLFGQIPMSGNAMAQARLILNMFGPGHGYSLVEGDGGSIGLGWKDTCLYTASCWASHNAIA